MKIYRAEYEDQEQTAAEAKRRGWDGGEGMLDYISGYGVRVGQAFQTQEEALTWLLDKINTMKTVFGCGDIDVIEQPKRRCRYCTCGGRLTVQSFLVDDTGIVEERDLSEECFDGKD